MTNKKNRMGMVYHVTNLKEMNAKERSEALTSMVEFSDYMMELALKERRGPTPHATIGKGQTSR